MLFARTDNGGSLIVGSLGWLPGGGKTSTWPRRILRELFALTEPPAFTFAWDGTIDLTDDHMPWLAAPEPGLHLVGGYNGRGIGQGTFWGKVLADWVAGAPVESLPMPVNRIPLARWRAARNCAYDAAFRASRLRQRLF
jgi:glycine/D-amino acid oxidase-like deaminating enzyme